MYIFLAYWLQWIFLFARFLQMSVLHILCILFRKQSTDDSFIIKAILIEKQKNSLLLSRWLSALAELQGNVYRINVVILL